MKQCPKCNKQLKMHKYYSSTLCNMYYKCTCGFDTRKNVRAEQFQKLYGKAM